MDLKSEIESILKYIVASNTFLFFLNDPVHRAYFKKEFDDSKYEKPEDKAILRFPTNFGPDVAYLLHPAIDFCYNNPDFNLDYLKRTLMVNINWVFENLPQDKQYSYNPKSKQQPYSKEFEFFRHVRNACSHGNIFNVSKSKNLWDKDQNYKAERNGMIIDLSLDGKKCFFDFISLGDAMYLLEYVRNNI